MKKSVYGTLRAAAGTQIAGGGKKRAAREKPVARRVKVEVDTYRGKQERDPCHN